jgi:MFS family permease
LKSKLINFLGFKTTSEKTALLFAIEGMLLALMTNIINNNNNLFASRLGASNFEISLVASLPQLIGMLVLIPGGIVTDRMKNKRKMIAFSLVLIAMLYIFIGLVPFFEKYQVIAFLGILALSAGPMTLYNTSWQAYFSDVVVEEERNRVFSLRTKWTFAVGITIPLITGTLLVSAETITHKIIYHQLFFFVAAFLIIIQVIVLSKIEGGTVLPQQHMNLGDLKRALGDLVKDKRYRSFVGVALFFYMVWQSDWTLYYLGQVNYLDFNEQWLSFVIVGGATIQFLSIGFWTRLNERLGIWFSIILGTLGLSIYPLAMIVSTSLPLSIGKPVFIVLIIVAGLDLQLFL